MKKYRQYRSNQGRSPRQMEGNYKVMYWACVGFLASLVIIGVINTVTTWLGK